MEAAVQSSSKLNKEPVSTKTVELEKEHELRFEIDFDSQVTIKLVEGTAESFGTELAQFREYSFNGSKGAIFTWHGCTLEITGPCHTYIATETPMVSYLNIHEAIEECRTKSAANNTQGPRVMLVGPTDSGKTSLSKTFLSYAARRGHQPIYVDLDIGQGSITVPGMLAAIPVDKPIPLGQDEFSSGPPLVFFYGHVTPSENVKLYKLQITNLGKDISKKFEDNADARSSGLVINTCGWVDGLGYELLVYSIDALQADIVLVIDHDRLYSDLTQLYKSKGVRVIKLAKSGGVVTRDPSYRRKSRMYRIREYFYGLSGDLCPHSVVVDFRDVVIYRVGGGPQAPQSALPIGATSSVDPVRLVEILPSSEIVHSLLGVSHAKTPENILDSNLAGFLYVTEVNFERQKITFLSPCPGALPSKYLILGSLKWLE